MSVPPDEGAGAGEPIEPRPEQNPPQRYRPSGAQWTLAGIMAAAGVGFGLYHVLKRWDLGQSAMLYVGIPLVLAIILTLSAPSKNPTGMAMKVITILLLLSVPILGEGSCCVLMAAPIIYLIAYLITRAVRRKDPDGRRGPAAFVVPALVAVMALEGVIPWLTPPGDAASAASRVVEVRASDVAAALAHPLRFDEVRPGGLLGIGFPEPLHDSGGLTVGGERIITFDGAHHRSGPMAQHHWGTHGSALTLRTEQVTADSVTFVPVADTTPLATWLRWDRIVVHWRAVDDGSSEITWELHYTRLLSPSWYFGPIERVVTWRAADYLVRAINTDAATAPHDHART